MLCPPHSVFPVYADKYLYVVYMNSIIHEIESTKLCYEVYTDKLLYEKNMNKEQYESISNKFCSVLYCTYTQLMYKISILNSYERYENHVIRIMLYENSVIEFWYA